MLGAGKGLEGMAQSLSQFIARRGEKRERDEERAYRSKRDKEEDAYRDRTLGLQAKNQEEDEKYRRDVLAREAKRDERGVVKDVLENLSGRKMVRPDFGQKAKEAGYGEFINDSTPFQAPFINPNNPMGGFASTAEDAGMTADPMIPPQVRAMIANNAEKLALAQQNAESLESYRAALAQARLATMGASTEALELRRELGRQAHERGMAAINSQNIQRAQEQARRMVESRYTDIQRMDPAVQSRIQGEVEYETARILGEAPTTFGGAVNPKGLPPAGTVGPAPGGLPQDRLRLFPQQR
jgi:hypothetical protein